MALASDPNGTALERAALALSLSSSATCESLGVQQHLAKGFAEADESFRRDLIALSKADARAALLAFLDHSEAEVEALAEALYFAHRGENQYRPDHPNEFIARASVRYMQANKELEPAEWEARRVEARAVLTAQRNMAKGEGK